MPRFVRCDPQVLFFAGDHKILGKSGIRRRIFFMNFANAGEARPAFELRAQAGELLGGAAGQDFHPSVVEITHETAQMQFGGDMLREIAEADALHPAGDEVSPGLLRLTHGN